MSQKVFIQVFIKSEKDLPQEDGYYFIKRKDTIGTGDGMIGYLNGIDNLFWLKNIDWYIQEKKLPTEDDASSKIVKSSLGKNSNDYYEGFMDCFDWLMSKLK